MNIIKYSSLITLNLLFLLPLSLSAQFDKWFEDKTLRMDFYHTGNYENENLFFDELLEEPFWAGSKKNMVDTNFYGDYYLNLFDLDSDELIYSRGFSTLFYEWRFTQEAIEEMSRCYSGCVVMPYPKKSVRIEIAMRDKKGVFQKKFEHIVDMNNYFIKKDRRLQFPVKDITINGDVSKKIDIVLLPDGYRSDEMNKFEEDCRLFAEGILLFSPYKEHRDKFNFRAVMAPSPESGTDIPADGVWKNTLLNTSFYTFDSERYLMTTDIKSVRDMAANAPYDFIYIIVNTDKYGGGAIYNHYGISVSGNQQAAKIYVHEFGHLFLGLGDEYVGTTSYDEMHPTDIEPWSANLTTLIEFEKKWKDMLDPDTPIPTPIDPQNLKRLGVYEGGGYLSKGIYRPWPDCLMNTLHGNEFCPVCSRAIERQIRFYTE